MMKKNNFYYKIAFFIVILIIFILIRGYFNFKNNSPETPYINTNLTFNDKLVNNSLLKIQKGEYLLMSDIQSICGFNKDYSPSCDQQVPCNGTIVNVKGYSFGDVAFPRMGLGYSGLGKVYSNDIKLIEFTGNFPRNYSEYYNIRDNNFGTFVIVKDIKMYDAEFYDELEEFKQKIESVQNANKEEANDMAIEVYVKNAMIIVIQSTIEGQCTQGIHLEAKKDDITFSMPN